MISQKKTFIDDKWASLLGTTTEHLASGRENNSYLLQEDEEQEAKKANTDAGVTAEANKTDEENSEIVISIKEAQKTLEYQETMKVDVKNIAKNKKTYRDQYLKLFTLHIFLGNSYFLTRIFGQVWK